MCITTNYMNFKHIISLSEVYFKLMRKKGWMLKYLQKHLPLHEGWTWMCSDAGGMNTSCV